MNNHLARAPITPNQEGTIEMSVEVLSSLGAQDIDTSRYQVSDLDDVEFYWKHDQLDTDAVFRPGMDTPLSTSNFNVFELGSIPENPILIIEEQDKKESSPPPTHPTTPLSERPTEPPALIRSRPFTKRIENVPNCIYAIFLSTLNCYCTCILIETIINLFRFIINFFKN